MRLRITYFEVADSVCGRTTAVHRVSCVAHTSRCSPPPCAVAWLLVRVCGAQFYVFMHTNKSTACIFGVLSSCPRDMTDTTTVSQGLFFFAEENISRIRPFIMRSDSELLIFVFRSEKKMGQFMLSDFAKSDGIKLI